ncbi:MAG: hypothetical protein WAM70_14100 [Pyrinomonadaceae bacterium]
MNTNSYVARKIVVLLALVAIVILSGARRGVQGQQWTGPDANGNISNANSGKVGVGTSAPVNLLDVGSAAIGTMLGNAIVVSSTTGPSSMAVGQSVTARGRLKWNFSGTEANAYLSLGVSAGTNPLILQDAGGNVGIGTMSPGARLYVAGGGYGSVGGANQSAYAFGAQSIAADASIYSYGAICAGNQHGNCASSGGVVIGINNTAAATNIPNTGNTIFNNGGSVGIGLTAPAYKLDVNGEINATGLRINGTPISSGGGSQWSGTGPIYYNTANVGIGTSNPGAKLHVSAGDSSFALFGPNPTWGGSLAVGSGNAFITPVSGRAQVLSSNGNLHLDGGSGQAVYLSWLNTSNTIINGQGGNVGVGTPTPGYRLDVNGEINATGIRINGTPISGSGQWTGTSSIYYNGGNVGIGTTSPSTKLELAPNSAIKLGNAYFSSGGDYVHLSNNEWYNGTSWTANAPGALIQISGQDVNFYRHDAAGSHTHSMNINSAGNVGIGTATPLYSLDVNGGVNGFRAKAATASSNDAIATFENSSGVQAIIRGNGYIGIGKPDPQYKLDVVGDIKASGTIHAKYQDLAEWVPSSEQLAAGTVVVLDTTKSNQVIASGTAYDTRVAGVISAQPGITLGESGEGKVLVATTGRVRVKVDASRGPIQIGDLLVTSEVAGVAMKSEPVEFAGRKMHMPGTIIGKALEPLAKGSSGEILVLLSLQ